MSDTKVIQRGLEGNMSEAVLDNIRTLFENMESHAALVEERMRDAGFAPDRAVAESVAKYWDALERLASE